MNTNSKYSISKGQIEHVQFCNGSHSHSRINNVLLPLQHVCHVRSSAAYLVCIMAREKRDIICSSKVVADLLDLPIAFPFPPLGSTILEPNLSNTRI